jgi:hypothetical protein
VSIDGPHDNDLVPLELHQYDFGVNDDGSTYVKHEHHWRARDNYLDHRVDNDEPAAFYDELAPIDDDVYAKLKHYFPTSHDNVDRRFHYLVNPDHDGSPLNFGALNVIYDDDCPPNTAYIIDSAHLWVGPSAFTWEAPVHGWARVARWLRRTAARTWGRWLRRR